MFDGVEMLCSLSVPALVALLVWRMWGVRVRVLLAVAYLTLMIPLFGIGMGGANILKMTLGGTIGGGPIWSNRCNFTARGPEQMGTRPENSGHRSA